MKKIKTLSVRVQQMNKRTWYTWFLARYNIKTLSSKVQQVNKRIWYNWLLARSNIKTLDTAKISRFIWLKTTETVKEHEKGVRFYFPALTCRLFYFGIYHSPAKYICCRRPRVINISSNYQLNALKIRSFL